MALNILVRFIALLSAGLIAGILFGYRMGASVALPTIPVSSFVQFQQVLHLSYVKFMPVFLIAASVSNLLWLFLLRGSVRSAGFVLLALATVGILFVFAITLMVNVPINKELMTWDASAPPANVLELWKRGSR